MFTYTENDMKNVKAQTTANVGKSAFCNIGMLAIERTKTLPR